MYHTRCPSNWTVEVGKPLILDGLHLGFSVGYELCRYSNGKLQRRSNTLRISRCIAFSSIHFFRVDGFTQKTWDFFSNPMQVQLALRWWIPVNNLWSKRGHGFKDETMFQVYNSTEWKTLQGFLLALQRHEAWCRDAAGETQSVQYQHCQAPTISDIAPNKNQLCKSQTLTMTTWCFQRFSVYPVVKWSSFTNAFQMGWSHHSS